MYGNRSSGIDLDFGFEDENETRLSESTGANYYPDLEFELS